MKLPAGTYYIGDPCYVMSNKEWSDILKPFWESEGELQKHNNHPYFMAGTAYGDGEYKDNHGDYYGVDAGLLGAIPAALCVEGKDNDYKYIECPDGLEVKWSKKSTFTFEYSGEKIVIKTATVQR
jgi:hypothetical protein